MQIKPFGRVEEHNIDLYILKNRNGLEATITSLGAILVALKVPDRYGEFSDVVLGYDNLEGYLQDTNFFGATIGRYANRIAGGRFSLNRRTHILPTNNGSNHLHGGPNGFHRAVWEATEGPTGGSEVKFSYTSNDGEEGYPGNLSVQVTYSLTDDNQLKIDYLGTTDQETVVNLTHHSYFNLNGHGTGDILRHELKLHASRFTPVDASLIPTGELRSVQNTPFDFCASTAIGKRIDCDDEQLRFGKGYDHNFVIDRGREGTLVQAAEVYDPDAGRVMEVLTTEPGIQFYSGNFLDASVRGKEGKMYPRRSAFCLETQHYPDSPNHPEFPSAVLKPGEEYRSTSVYRFATR